MIFFSIIFLVGILTTFTDLRNKKIYNRDLGVGAVLGLIALITLGLFRHEHVLFHLVNGIAAFCIGLLLHRFELWRGGDAKLFTLFAFLMPPPIYNIPPLPCVINLFACSFIAGSVVLIPVLIKDILMNQKTIAENLFVPAKIKALFKAILSTVLFSWVLFPFYYLARITNPVIILAITYLLFSWGYQTNLIKLFVSKLFKKDFVLFWICIIFGLLVRLWLSPASLTLPILIFSILRIALVSTLSASIYAILDLFKKYQERISFAPLLFTGCLLSYTPFLTKLMHVVTQCNVLVFR